MVNLVVCNPNKAKEEERKAADGKLNLKGSTARSPTPTQPAVPEKPSRFQIILVSWLKDFGVTYIGIFSDMYDIYICQAEKVL